MVVGAYKDKFEFTSHNIRLDDGTFTKPESTRSMVDHPWFISARGILETVFPGIKVNSAWPMWVVWKVDTLSSSHAWDSRFLGLTCVS
jgi:hypothetical protein